MFESWLSNLVSKHANSGVLLDSNLLLLYGVGIIDSALVEKEKGTRDYSVDDFELLSQFLGRFNHLVTTPNIMTEASNLAGRLREHIRGQFRILMRTKLLEIMQERYVATRDAVSPDVFDRLGVTDATIGVLADQGTLVLTDDLDLSIVLESRQMDCLHFTRTLRPLTL